MAGKNAASLDKSCCGHGVGCLVPIWNIYQRTKFRKRLRKRMELEGTKTNDCLTVTFCPCCAIVQESVEISFFFDGGMMARE